MPPAERLLVRGSLTDIRERKRSERELSRREREFRTLAENSPDWIVRVDLDLRRTYVNRAVLNASGAPLEEMLGKTPTEAFPDSEEMRVWEEALRRARDTGQQQTFERETRLGEPRFLQTSIVPEFDDAGRIESVLSVTRDITSVRRAVEAETRLARTGASARLGMWTFRRADDSLVWSEEAAAIYRRSVDEMPKTMREAIALMHPEDRPQARARVLGREAVGGEPREYRIRLPDGSYRWIAGVGDLGEFGAPEVGGIIIDIHDRKMAENAVKESEERFRDVVESVSAGIWVFDGTRILLVNAAAEQLTGMSRAELMELESLERLVGPDVRASMLERAQQRLGGTPLPRGYEVSITRADGTDRRVELTGSRIDFRGIPAVIISAFDVTERHLNAQALRESESRFRALVDSSPDFITRIDADLRHDFVNVTAIREAGLDPEFVLGKRVDEFGYPPEQAELLLQKHREVFRTGEPVEFEFTINSLKTPGQLSYRRARLMPEKGEDGTVHHLLSVVTDITAERLAEEERRRLDQQVQHTQKLESLGVLAGGIAHDFNNLLVAILGNAGLALMELPADSPARQTVQAIETASQRAAELTRQMLAYSGRGQFVIEPFNVSRVVEEMAHLLEVSISKRVTLRYDFAPDLPNIDADATQVRQVIMNLIINASDAIGEQSGQILVKTGLIHADREYLQSTYLENELPEGDYVYLEVSDTGSGMDAETQARIFDPFFTTKFTGRGLGLAAVLGIVRGHHGTIRLDSEPGRGSTFRVLFPARSRPAAEVAAPIGTQTANVSGARVLVIDDDATVRQVTRRILELAGFSVVLAASGREGLRHYSEEPGVSVVLLDLTMPEMDGEETFRLLREKDPGVRVVITSGFSKQDTAERFPGTGLAGFIQKPYRPGELIEAIAQALGGEGGQDAPSNRSNEG
jgi:PAS domain S-box-containing protein